jgi:hypothetical protein
MVSLLSHDYPGLICVNGRPARNTRLVTTAVTYYTLIDTKSMFSALFAKLLKPRSLERRAGVGKLVVHHSNTHKSSLRRPYSLLQLLSLLQSIRRTLLHFRTQDGCRNSQMFGTD